MTLVRLVLFVHILAGVILLGHSLLSPLLLAATRRASTLEALRAATGLARQASRANPIAAFAVLASGIYLATGRWAEAWLYMSCAQWVVSAALSAAVVLPIDGRLHRLAAAAGDGPLTAEIDATRRSTRWTVASDAVLAGDLAVLCLMTLQPGLLGSLLVIGGANAAFPALRRAQTSLHALSS